MIRISVYHKILRNVFVIFTNIGLLLSITLSVYAEDDNGTFPVQSRGNLWFTSDILQYQDQNNRTRIEILYTVNLDKFWNEFQTSDSLLLGVTCRISDKENNLLSETARKKRFYLKSQSTEQELTYIDVIRYSLVPDLYRIEMTTFKGEVRNYMNKADERHTKTLDRIAELYEKTHKQITEQNLVCKVVQGKKPMEIKAEKAWKQKIEKDLEELDKKVTHIEDCVNNKKN